MALIKCPECGHDVSTLADRCPNCGAPVATFAHAPKPPAWSPAPAPAQEHVIFHTRLHWSVFLAPLVVVLIAIGFAMAIVSQPFVIESVGTAAGRALQVVAFVVGVASLFWLFVRFVTWISSSVTLTDRRLTAQQGFISRHTTDIPLSKIESVSVNRGLGGLLLGYGTMVVTGSGGTQERFYDIAGARELSSEVQMQIADLRGMR
jgi:uncharacterized membrane protein YdbT with pleckstrin-like domain/rRNA maturation protein Nop10